MLAEFGDSGENSIVGGLIEEDGVIRLFVDFSLGPFLHRQSSYFSGGFLALGLSSGLCSFCSGVSFLGHLWI